MSLYTDDENAIRFVTDYQNTTRYVPAWDCWMVWDGARWLRDDAGQVWQLWIQSARGLYDNAMHLGEKKMITHAQRSLNSGGIEACLKVACRDPGLVTLPSAWDANPWLFNVNNGLIDLKTGEISSHDPSHLITKLADVTYDAEAQCPLFQQFMAEIFNGDQTLVAFMQRVFGVCLTGVTRDQAVYILYGLGANGKSTLLKVLENLLGEYHRTASQSAFVEDRSDNNTYDALAGLHGARAVTCTEPGRSRALNEAVIKRISGSDMISARFLHGHFFAYHPTFKALLAVNHKPTVYGTDRGIWRRLKMIPFDVSFEGREDQDLSNKLKVEMPGILNWALAGCRAWQDQGLNPPGAVLTATADYQKDMDELGPWIDERCNLAPGLETRMKDLYVSYKEWHSDEGGKDKALTSKAFSLALTERGIVKKRDMRGMTRLGIALKTEAERNTPLDDYDPVQTDWIDQPEEPED
jgi:putative DNA primase/helicase